MTLDTEVVVYSADCASLLTRLMDCTFSCLRHSWCQSVCFSVLEC